MIWHLYALWNDHHNKSSNHTVITILLTTFLMLYITPPGFIHFIPGSSYLWIPFTYFSISHPLHPGNYPFVLCMCESDFVLFFPFFFFLDFTYKWDHRVFIFLWVISLSIMPSRANHVVANAKISFLRLNNIRLHVHVPHLLYLAFCQWALRLLPYFGCCK